MDCTVGTLDTCVVAKIIIKNIFKYLKIPQQH